MRYLGVFAHLLGISPRDWDTLTVEETDTLVDYVDDVLAKQEEGN